MKSFNVQSSVQCFGLKKNLYIRNCCETCKNKTCFDAQHRQQQKITFLSKQPK